MVQTVQAHDPRAPAFDGLDGAHPTGTPRVASLRKAALDRFTALGFPSPKDEAWRNADVAPIARTRFRMVPASERPGIAPAALAPFGLGVAGPTAVFVNGHFATELSSLASLPEGVRVEGLSAALERDPSTVERHLGRHADFEGHPFRALNTAFFQDGAYVEVPRGVVLDRPVHLLHVFAARPGKPVVAHPRNLIVVGENAQASVVETYAGLDGAQGGVYFTNAVTELVAGEGAVVERYKVQREGEGAFHFASLDTTQGRASNVSDHLVSLGGASVRNEVNAVLDGEGAELLLNGLFVGTGSQRVDNVTRIDHAQAHCGSREVYKGVLGGHARGAFTGRIVVRPGAQKTDAKQTNKNLLLSGDALVDSTPQLEIYADDVKCTHGSTIGQLDREQLFYLRSRGLAEESARTLLTVAFARDVLSRMRLEPLRERLDGLLTSWIRGILAESPPAPAAGAAGHP